MVDFLVTIRRYVYCSCIKRTYNSRVFLIGVLLAPTILGAFWLATFGTTAVNMQMTGVRDLAKSSTELTIFEMFSEMPWPWVLSIVAVLLIASFFITSADSATFVLGMQSTYGSLTPPNTVKLGWGIIQSTIVVILLSVNGLTALQNAIIIAALPFSFIIVLMVIALLKGLKAEMLFNEEKKITKTTYI